MSHKWHYFKADNELCYYEKWICNSKVKLVHFTACNRFIGDVRRHTEFKDTVTCLACLRVINDLAEREILEGDSHA